MCKVIVICLAYITYVAASTGDHMEWWEYWKLCSLADELMVEAKNRIQQTENIRDMLAGESGFQIGMIMGKIRDKYRTMMEVYRMTSNKHELNPDITIPAMTPIKPLYYIVRMEIIHALEVEIDELVRVLEALPPWDLEPSMNFMEAINEEQTMRQKERERLALGENKRGERERLALAENPEDPAKVIEKIKDYNKNYLRTHQRPDQFTVY